MDTRNQLSSEGDLRLGSWVIGAGTILGGTLLAGRVTGFLREVQLSSTLGLSSQADAAVLLLTLPDLLVNLLLSGGLSAALIPRLRAVSLEDAQVLMRQTLVFALTLFGLFAILLVAAPTLWFGLLAPGLSAEKLPPTAAILITAIAIPLAAASGVTTAGLNSQNKFLVAGCGTLIFNLAVMLALACGSQNFNETLILLGMGIAAGAGLRLLSQLLNLPSGWLIGPLTQPPIDTVLIRGFIATAATTSLMLLVPVIVRAFASTVNPGAIAALNYATKMVELPAGVLITSLATVALVRLSVAYGQQDIAAAQETLHIGLKRSLTNAIGAGGIVAYFAGAIVEITFGRGAMDSAAIQRVVALTQILMATLPFLAVIGMAMATLNAQEKSLTVLKVTLACLFFLPLFALPGVCLGSEMLLAWSIVGFQILQALMLAYKVGLMSANGRAWCDRKLALSLLIVSMIIILTISLDLCLVSTSYHSSYLQVFLACVAITAVLVFAQPALANRKLLKVERP